MKIKSIVSSLLMLSAILTSLNASAIPAFARKNHLQCSACHTAYPLLSATGRNFKEAGYRFPGSSMGDTKITDHLNFDATFPMSLAIISRPYTDTKNAPKEIRAIHEAEIFAGGEISKEISGFAEIEAEGEDGFGLVFSGGQVTYSHSPELNVQTGYGQTLMADPYDTYSDMRRLTASHFELFNQQANNDNGDKLRHARQQFSLYGRIANKIFYNVGVGGLTGDVVGSDSGIYFGRVAYDISPSMMIGTMALQGTCKTTNPVTPDTDCSTTNLDFTRVAIDGQFDINNLRLTGVFMNNNDDTTAGPSDNNNSYYVQGIYIIRQDGRPVIVPLIRLEGYEKNDGNDNFSVATVNIGYYFTENVKGFIEFQDTYDTPTGTPTDSATTVEFEVVF